MSIIYGVLGQLVCECFRNHNQQRVPAFRVPICHISDYIWIILKTKNPSVYRRVLMWALRDLNPGPTDYESAALTNWAKGPYYGMCLICDQERTQIMASIYYRLDKSGNKRYYGSIYNNGKRIRKFLGCSRQSVQALIKKFEYELLLNIERSTSESKPISF